MYNFYKSRLLYPMVVSDSRLMNFSFGVFLIFESPLFMEKKGQNIQSVLRERVLGVHAWCSSTLQKCSPRSFFQSAVCSPRSPPCPMPGRDQQNIGQILFLEIFVFEDHRTLIARSSKFSGDQRTVLDPRGSS